MAPELPILMIVDDEPLIIEMVSEVGRMTGYEPIGATSFSELKMSLKQTTPDVLVLDFILPGLDGNDLLEWITENKVEAPVILISGYEDLESRIDDKFKKTAIPKIVGELHKPFRIAELEELLIACKSIP